MSINDNFNQDQAKDIIIEKDGLIGKDGQTTYLPYLSTDQTPKHRSRVIPSDKMKEEFHRAEDEGRQQEFIVQTPSWEERLRQSFPQLTELMEQHNVFGTTVYVQFKDWFVKEMAGAKAEAYEELKQKLEPLSFAGDEGRVIYWEEILAQLKESDSFAKRHPFNPTDKTEKNNLANADVGIPIKESEGE